MTTNLAKMKAALAAMKGPKSNPNGFYKFWDLQPNESVTLRFLPDNNEENTFFWYENQTIRLPFKGTVANPTVAVEATVPCIETWDGKMTCPILNEARLMWKNEDQKILAQKYWVKRKYFMQALVVAHPKSNAALAPPKAPASPIVKLSIGPQIFKVIYDILNDPSVHHSPVDYDHGLDFTISKTVKGGFADYSTSKWARNETVLDQATRDLIKQHGLNDLASMGSAKPSPKHIEVMKEMFDASIGGGLYDDKRWGAFYKAY